MWQLAWLADADVLYRVHYIDLARPQAKFPSVSHNLPGSLAAGPSTSPDSFLSKVGTTPQGALDRPLLREIHDWHEINPLLRPDERSNRVSICRENNTRTASEPSFSSNQCCCTSPITIVISPALSLILTTPVHVSFAQKVFRSLSYSRSRKKEESSAGSKNFLYARRSLMLVAPF